MEAYMSDAIRDNVRKLRRLAGMSQEEFGEIAGVSRGAVSQYESGFSEPRMGVIQSYSDYFGIPKSWIIEDGGMDGVTRGVTGQLHRESHGEPIELTNDERDLILKLRGCPEDVREAIETIIDAIA